MCMGTSIKKIWWYAGWISVLISIGILIASSLWRVWWKAIANNHLDTLWAERIKEETKRENNTKDHAQIQSDLTAIKTDVERIVKTLDKIY